MIVHRFAALVPLKSKINGKGTHKEQSKSDLKFRLLKFLGFFAKSKDIKTLPNTDYQ